MQTSGQPWDCQDSLCCGPAFHLKGLLTLLFTSMYVKGQSRPVWWHTCMIPTLRREGQENYCKIEVPPGLSGRFQPSQDYRVSREIKWIVVIRDTLGNFILFILFYRGSHCTALVDLEKRLAFNSQRSSCLNLLSVGIKDMSLYTWPGTMQQSSGLTHLGSFCPHPSIHPSIFECQRWNSGYHLC